MELFSTQGLYFLLRYVHFLAGITWIGLLWYFNFVQGSFFKDTDANTKSVATQQLVPRALWWFRWGAMVTFLSGAAILTFKYHVGGAEAFASSWGLFITTGAVLGTIMFLNVWLIIWPNQKIVIASAQAAAGGGKPDPRTAAAAAKAGLASRTNTLFSIPMLFFMGAALHLPILFNHESHGMLHGALTLIIVGLEANGIKGKLGPLTTVKGVITCGFLLTAVLYAVMVCLA